MNSEPLMSIFINACLINNFVLSCFLGICPFLGVSSRIDTAVRLGLATASVMVISSSAAYGINIVLTAINAPYLALISYVLVIASMVQLVEMVIKKFSPSLFRALGIFLPLITTNCAILGQTLFQTSRGYNFIQCIVFALGAGLGFTLALLIMSGLREELDLSDAPDVIKGTALSLIVAGILSLAFMGFAGLSG
jgi:electron transport complex protein RnfA